MTDGGEPEAEVDEPGANDPVTRYLDALNLMAKEHPDAADRDALQRLLQEHPAIAAAIDRAKDDLAFEHLALAFDPATGEIPNDAWDHPFVAPVRAQRAYWEGFFRDTAHDLAAFRAQDEARPGRRGSARADRTGWHAWSDGDAANATMHPGVVPPNVSHDGAFAFRDAAFAAGDGGVRIVTQEVAPALDLQITLIPDLDERFMAILQLFDTGNGRTLRYADRQDWMVSARRGDDELAIIDGPASHPDAWMLADPLPEAEILALTFDVETVEGEHGTTRP